MRGSVVYLDNAATSFPKPPVVWDALLNYAKNIGANPGRSGHTLSVEAARIVFSCRRRLAELMGVSQVDRVIFTKNATEAANYVIFGLLSRADGGNVVATSFEHNAVARPLKYWCRRRGIELRVVGGDGRVEVGDVLDAVDGDTIAVFVNHGSNVVGSIFPFEEVAVRVRPVPLVLDATQTFGCYPFTVDGLDNVILLFTGHKSLLGPQGTGGFYLPEGIDFEPLMMGGTGSLSEKDEQPDFLPDRYESGTLNVHGIAGLNAALGWLREKGIDAIRRHELELIEGLLEGLSSIRGVVVYGSGEPAARVAVVSFNVEGMDPASVAEILDREYGIATRHGLHCAPWAHRCIGTYPVGTVRLSLGPFNTPDDVEYVVNAISRIAEGAHGC